MMGGRYGNWGRLTDTAVGAQVWEHSLLATLQLTVSNVSSKQSCHGSERNKPHTHTVIPRSVLRKVEPAHG